MIKKVSLFTSKRDYFLAIIIIVIIAFYSILIEYNNYKQLTRFDSSLVSAVVKKHYIKSKLTKRGKTKTYQVLKLQSENGFNFYTTCKSSIAIHLNQKIDFEIWAGKISFYEYLSSFYAYSKIINIAPALSTKRSLNTFLSHLHESKNISAIYQALYTATPLNQELQTKFSRLGISHLIAISGFHLSVLSAILFFLLKYPYKFLQNRYFPYRNYKLDLFFLVSIVLFFYLNFLDSPPALLRSFSMFIIGFILYDRGIKVISMQTLLLITILLLALFPRLLFSIGFLLSISGVFYIFLFISYFKHHTKIWQFLFLPLWLYLLMLPYSIVIFHHFSIYHPLSILWTIIFTIFYPFSIFLHLIGLGDLLDIFLKMLLNLSEDGSVIKLSFIWLFAHITLSFLSIWRKEFLLLLLFLSVIFFVQIFTPILLNRVV